MTPVPDFPSELVEAAAKAAMEAEPGQNWECATAKEADVYLRDSLAVLAVVVPLIEQRVIDRLAQQAGGNPWDGRLKTAAQAWREGAACGVAAERARIRRVIRDLYDDPPETNPALSELLQHLEDGE